ncbi:MAG: S1 RNA-binding domain-containing protein [Nitrososphaerota archaeon]|nr:S1 RNA-binding domain-containing protein [Candidatus Calditenuaceae archaeon]MDW8073866.1 S1 RNA-binding domain-containing protein [Nitrososphaerota archaeon]
MSAGGRFPQQGELVIGTVTRVMRHGVVVRLEEYDGLEAFVPLSEISMKWVRNIRDFLREGQRTVFRVVRSSPESLQVDVSLRRVTPKEKAEKMAEWNKVVKVSKMLSILAEKTGVDKSVIEAGLVKPAAERRRDLYELMEDIAAGDEVPSWVNLPAEVKSALVEFCKKEIKKTVSVSRVFVNLYAGRGGVGVIRRAAQEAMSLAGGGEKLSITVIGPPRYLLRVEAATPERVEELKQLAIKRMAQIVSEHGGRASVEEGKK